MKNNNSFGMWRYGKASEPAALVINDHYGRGLEEKTFKKLEVHSDSIGISTVMEPT